MTTPSAPNNYYYAPPTQGGPFETHLSEAGNLIGPLLMVGAAYLGNPDAMRLGNMAAGGAGQFAAQITSSALGNLGQMIDNLPRVFENFETAIGEMNDPNSWMTPDLAD